MPTRCALTADRCQIAIRCAGMVCDLLRSYIPYYNRAAVLSCTAFGVAVVSGYRCRASGCVCALQRGVGGVISAFAGLVLYVVEWVKLPETHL